MPFALNAQSEVGHSDLASSRLIVLLMMMGSLYLLYAALETLYADAVARMSCPFLHPGTRSAGKIVHADSSGKR